MMVGSEGGAVLKLLLEGSGGRRTKKVDPGVDLGMPWTTEAQALLARISDISDKKAVRREVERYAKDKRIATINLEDVYAAKPEPRTLFPSPSDVAFDRHEGPVHSIDCSPFHRGIFLTCGADGMARVSSAIDSSPLLSFESGAPHLMTAAWSRTRPCVFGIAGNDGEIHIFDLAQSTVAPAAQFSPQESSELEEDRARGACPTNSMAFNPRQREFLASGDHLGRVHVWGLPWSLATPSAGEMLHLENLYGMASTGEGEAEEKRGAEGDANT